MSESFIVWKSPTSLIYNGVFKICNFLMFVKWQSSMSMFNQIWQDSKYESKKSLVPFLTIGNCDTSWWLFQFLKKFNQKKFKRTGNVQQNIPISMQNAKNSLIYILNVFLISILWCFRVAKNSLICVLNVPKMCFHFLNVLML